MKGYIRIPRSLLNDTLWRELTPKCHHIFFVILEHAVFRQTEFISNNQIFILQPGQFCTTIRKLVELSSGEISKNDVERSIYKLILCGFLRQEVRHKKSILTISHKDTYDLIIEASETINETIMRQKRDNNETEKNNDKNAKKEKNIFLSDSIEIGLAEFLFSKIKTFLENPKTPNFQSWALQVRHMLQLDKRTPNEIRNVIEWLYTPEGVFWRKNILSTAKLREQFDRLKAEIKLPITPQNKQVDRRQRLADGSLANGGKELF